MTRTAVGGIVAIFVALIVAGCGAGESQMVPVVTVQDPHGAPGETMRIQLDHAILATDQQGTDWIIDPVSFSALPMDSKIWRIEVDFDEGTMRFYKDDPSIGIDYHHVENGDKVLVVVGAKSQLIDDQGPPNQESSIPTGDPDGWWAEFFADEDDSAGR